MASWFSRPSRGRRVDGVEGNATGAARGGRRKVTWQRGAARQCPPVRSAPNEGASRISNSGGHERRSSVQQAQSRWPWSRPARQSLLSVPPWCWCNRRGCSRSPKLPSQPRRAATAAGYALSICKALLMCRDASPSRVLVAGRTVYWGGGDASGKRSASDGYSGWDARARTSGSARLAFQSRGVEGQSRELSGRTAGDVGAFCKVCLKASASWLDGS